MAIYLDSADIEDARRAQALGFVRAVTTNPTHISKTGRPGLDVLRELLTVVDKPVFYQVTAEIRRSTHRPDMGSSRNRRWSRGDQSASDN